jgi:cytochrome c peroxidase
VISSSGEESLQGFVGIPKWLTDVRDVRKVGSDEVNSFSSKRDKALASDADGQFPLDGFTDQENLGHDLFYGKAGCVVCHNSAGSGSEGEEPKQLYADHAYHNIGVPLNPEIPDAGRPQGLFDHTDSEGHKGHWDPHPAQRR